MTKNNIHEDAVQFNPPKKNQRLRLQTPNGFINNRPEQTDYFNHAAKRTIPNQNPTGIQYKFGANAESAFKTEFVPQYQKVSDALESLASIVTVDTGAMVGNLFADVPGNEARVLGNKALNYINNALLHVRNAIMSLDSAKTEYQQALRMLGVDKNVPDNNHFGYYHIKESVEKTVRESLHKLLKEQKEKGGN